MDTKARNLLVEEVRSQWKGLWRERFDDKVRAEGIASKDYDKLFVDKGTVVLATRDYRNLTLKEILELHRLADVERYVSLGPEVGGWGKFVRTMITRRQSFERRRFAQLEKEKRRSQQLKKGGRGWLHV